MALLRRSFKYSLPLRDKFHALLLVGNYRRLNLSVHFNAGITSRSANIRTLARI
jgi:hypothetical protein